MAVGLRWGYRPLRNGIGVAALAFLPWSRAAVGQGYRISPRNDVRDEAEVLLEVAQLMTLLTDHILVSALLPIGIGLLDDMAGAAEVGLILGIAIVPVTVEENRDHHDRKDEALEVLTYAHGRS